MDQLNELLSPALHSAWLALSIGNSRLHWAAFTGTTLCATWDTPHLSAIAAQTLMQTQFDFAQLLDLELTPLPIWNSFPTNIPLVLASVVPSQAALWQSYPGLQVITLDQIPLQNLYPTLGIDRALALYGAGSEWGFPVLVIDSGTALTFTGANANQGLVGGAILPGLGLQLRSLTQNTAALPPLPLPEKLPPRWATQTAEAIQSGVIYTVLAGIRDFVQAWWQEFPDSAIALTGGDSQNLLNYLQVQFPELAEKAIAEPNLIFWGICRVYIPNACN